MEKPEMMEKVSGFIIVWKLRFHTIINAPRRVRENVSRHILFYYTEKKK